MKTRSGYLFQKRSGGNWYVRTVVDGKPITKSTGTANRRNAEKRRAEIMRPYTLGDQAAVLQAVGNRLKDTEAQAAALHDELNPPPEIGAIWGRYMDSPARPDSGDRTLVGYETQWRRFACWLSDKHPKVKHLHEITPAMAADYARDLTAAKVSASTYNQHRGLLRLVWRVLADECRLTANPWDKITPRKLNALANRKQALTPGQFDNLLAAAETDTDLHDLLTLLAWTGLRLADAVLMKWGVADFPARVISLAPIKTARRQGKVVHIPMFPAALAVLNRRQAGKAINPAGYVFPDLAAKYERDPTAISKRIQKAFERAGMETTVERADRSRRAVVYGAHSLRHFFVSVATAAGMPAAMVKSITGHATDAMLEHYQHIGAGLASEIAARISTNGTGKAVPAALPPGGMGEQGDALATLKQAVKAIVEGMTPGTLQQDRAALLALVD